MKQAIVRSQIVKWFEIHEVGGLILPDGWFGRPYDNHFYLEDVKWNDNCWVIEFDGNGILRLWGEIDTNEESKSLSLSGFDRLTFDWIDEASLEPHTYSYDSGIVELVAILG